MTKNIFITATNTEVGKTYTTLKLIEKLSRDGYKVGVFKPIESGVDYLPPDGSKLLNRVKEFNSEFNLTLKDIVPIQFKLPAAPYVAKKDKPIDFKKIQDAYNKIANISDIVLIEGAGGLLTPVDKEFFIVDFIDMFNAFTLLVTTNKLGSINETLLSLELLKSRSIKYSWYVNHYEDSIESFNTITRPFYDKEFGYTPNLSHLYQDILNHL
jgi:dethiobiotin synthetase